MTINQQQTQALQDNWEEVKGEITSTWPGVPEGELDEFDPETVGVIAEATNTGVSEVEGRLGAIGQRYLDQQDQDQQDQANQEAPHPQGPGSPAGMGDQGQMVQPTGTVEPTQPDPQNQAQK